MIKILITGFCILVSTSILAQDSLFLISDLRMGEIRIGDSIQKHPFRLVSMRRYEGDGYKFFENSYLVADSCLVTVGFNSYIGDTATISYLSTSCDSYHLASGIRVGISIQEMLALDKEIRFEIGYGPEFFYTKTWKNSWVRLWTNAAYNEEELLAMDEDQFSEIVWEGSVVAIELIKIEP